MQPFFQSFATQFGLIPTWALASLIVFLRYLIMAGGVYLFFYVWTTNRFSRLKIQRRSPERRQVLNEMKYSFYTSLIFALMAMLVFAARQFGYTRHYLDIQEYGWGYFIFTMVFLVFAHDAYFYWMHRLMHRPRLFRLLHRVHHQSFNPTPMASLSFHPLEALLEFGIVPLIVFIVPIHPLALMFLSLWSMVFNIYGHLGFEFLPKGFATHWFWGWFNTSTHHNMHHQRSGCNYGLYFNIWDRWMNTNHPDYIDTFNKVRSTAHNLIETV